MDRQHSVIGGTIRRARRALDITQQELADRLSISVQSVSQWENGRTKPDESRVGQIARILGIDIQEFDFDKVEQPRDKDMATLDGSIIENLIRRYAEPVESLAELLDIRSNVDVNDLREGAFIARHPGRGRLFLYRMADSQFAPEIRDGDQLLIDGRGSLHVGDYGVFADLERNVTMIGQVRRIGIDDRDVLTVDVRLSEGQSDLTPIPLDWGRRRLLGVVVELTRPMNKWSE